MHSPTTPKLRFKAAVRGVQTASRLRHLTGLPGLNLPLASGTLGHDDLSDLHPVQEESLSLMRRASKIVDISVDDTSETTAVPQAGASFWLSAGVAVALGLTSSMPYNILLSRDPGCPLFISFIVHLVVVGSNLSKVRTFLYERKLPLRYHVCIVLLSYLFNMFKCNAFARLPTPVCFLLLNLRMLVGVVVQRLFFSKRYSFPQLAGCMLVTIGVTLAGWSMNSSSKSGGLGVGSNDFVLGAVEMLISLLALQFMGIIIKKAFTEFGECVDEQLFMQHSLALPLFLQSSQWTQIQPRFHGWFMQKDWVMLPLLLASVLCTFGSRVATVQMAGRAPNPLMVQLVQTLEKFLTLFLSALMHAPPWPPLGFWFGSAVLISGTLQFLSASEVPETGGKDTKKT